MSYETNAGRPSATIRDAARMGGGKLRTTDAQWVRMKDALTRIPGHLKCVKCGYDLFGASVDGACAECGTSLRAIVRMYSTGSARGGYNEFIRLFRIWLRAIGRRTNTSASAVRFVLDGMKLARRPNPTPIRSFWLYRAPRPDISARQLCRGVRGLALEYFMDRAEAIELLSEWKLQTSEDVGRITFALVDLGLFEASSKDTIEQFHGIFTLDNLFEEW